MRALLVVNPKATVTTAAVRDVVTSALASACRLEVVETKAHGHGAELARAAVGDSDVVVVLGGDGTVNEVVNGLLGGGPGPDVPSLAVVPGGSANVLARALGLPRGAVEATSVLLEALRSERRRTIGLGRVEDRWFTCNAGLGFDAAVVRRVDRNRAAGQPATPARYVRSGLREFLGTDRRGAALTLERAGAEPQELALALVCNTSPWTYLGSRPVVPCPRASFDTGLDVFGLTRLGLLSTLRHTGKILARRPRPGGRRVVHVHDAAELTLRATAPLPFQLDGEDLGDRTHVVLQSVPGALSVVL